MVITLLQCLLLAYPPQSSGHDWVIIAELATRLLGQHEGTMALALHCEPHDLMTKRAARLGLPRSKCVWHPKWGKDLATPCGALQHEQRLHRAPSGSTLERKPPRLPLGDAVRKLEGPVAPPLQ